MTVIGIDWRVGDGTGWEVFGAHLAAGLHDLGADVRLLFPHEVIRLPASLRERLAGVLDASQPHWNTPLDAPAPLARFPVLRAVGNGFDAGLALLMRPARHNLAVVFLENTHLPPGDLANARNFDRILAGSVWNARFLGARGLEGVEVVHQGVDEVLFRPGPRTGRWPGRFVVFSGGKLEYRKGQDIVVAAFREFVRRHPEALLVTCWHNPWPDTVRGVDRAGHVSGVPALHGGRLDFTGWTAANGIPPGAHVDLGTVAHRELPAILREVDVGVFPNRAEGGTNLVLMEAMACGVCSIVSANTGHLDVAGDNDALLLREQRVVAPWQPDFGTAGWGESSVDEVVAALERAHADADLRQRLGGAAARRMAGFTWRKTAERVWQLLHDSPAAAG